MTARGALACSLCIGLLHAAWLCPRSQMCEASPLFRDVRYDFLLEGWASRVAISDLNGDGAPDLVAANDSFPPDSSSSVHVIMSNGDLTFQPPARYLVGETGRSLGVEDLDQDGVQDLVVEGPGGETDVIILMGRGDGTFLPTSEYDTYGSPKAMVIGDLDNDGVADVATVGYWPDGYVSVLLGNGDGTFLPHVAYAAGQYPEDLIVEDLDGDGALDLVTANYKMDGDPAVEQVTLLFGNGDGTFQPAVRLDAGRAPCCVAAGDLNGDGYPDLVVGNGVYSLNYWGSTLSFLFGNGDGTFQALTSLEVGITPESVTLGDLNGDDVLDVVTHIGFAMPEELLLLGNGDGTFQAPLSIPSGSSGSCAIGDMNGDGLQDLASPSFIGATVILGNGDGTFRTAPWYDTGGEWPVSVAAGDVDGDGYPDLAVANRDSDNVSVLIGKGDGEFLSAVRYAAGASPSGVVMGNLDGDGFPDLAVANEDSGDVLLLLNLGDGTFMPAVGYEVGESASALSMGDLDGNETLDLVVASEGDYPDSLGYVSILLGDGHGVFSQEENYAVDYLPRAVAIGDLNGDGAPDLAVTNGAMVFVFPDPSFREGYLSVLLGNGDGTFQDALQFPDYWDPDSLAVGDLNGDARPDLVIAYQTPQVIAWPGFVVLVSNPDGTFRTTGNYWMRSVVSALAIGEVDGDGMPDLVMGHGNITVYPGRGDGTFMAPLGYGTMHGTRSVAISDLQGDGAQDLAVCGGSDGRVSVFLNTGGTCIDEDEDGYGQPANPGCLYTQGDCDDTSPDIHPGALEICDGIDNNCAEGIDECSNHGNPCTEGSCVEGEELCVYSCLATSWEDPCCQDPVCTAAPICEPPPCLDEDGDGYGVIETPACPSPGLDCDDSFPDIHPGAPEVCDGVDNNCVEGIDEDPAASESCSNGIFCDGAERCDTALCASTGPPCPDDGLWCNGLESCDEVSDQCVNSGNPCAPDGNPCTDDSCSDGEALCLYSCGATGWEDPCCEDLVCAAAPLCDPPPCVDEDQDGYGAVETPECAMPAQDCDDSRADVNPGAMEELGSLSCSDGLDNDCDGVADAADIDCWAWRPQASESSTLGGSAPTNYLAFLLIPMAAILILRAKRAR